MLARRRRRNRPFDEVAAPDARFDLSVGVKADEPAVVEHPQHPRQPALRYGLDDDPLLQRRPQGFDRARQLARRADQKHPLRGRAEGRLHVDRGRGGRPAQRVFAADDFGRRRRQREFVEQRGEADLALQSGESLEVRRREAGERRQTLAEACEKKRLFVRRIEDIETTAGEQRRDALQIAAGIEPEARRRVETATEAGEARQAQRIGVDDFDVESGAAEAGQRLCGPKGSSLPTSTRELARRRAGPRPFARSTISFPPLR